MKGRVLSGGTSAQTTVPVAGAVVYLYEATSGEPRLLGTAESLADGSFEILPSQTSSSSIFYAQAHVGYGVLLATVIGPQLPGNITLNELTTVAAVWSCAQFIGPPGDIRGNGAGLRVAAMMAANLVDIATGASSPVITSSPNGDETNTLRETRSLANLLAPCVRTPGGASQDWLIALTTPPGGLPAKNTFLAMNRIARTPAYNVAEIYAQSMYLELYQPALTSKPDAWTLAVKVNQTGTRNGMNELFGGPGNIAFDSNGNAWIPNNVIQGQGGSSPYSFVLGPDGHPSPLSPITGGGILGPGFGVAVDQNGIVWIGNFGWGGNNPQLDHGISLFRSSDGVASSSSSGIGLGTYKVQGIAIDQNVWAASFGNSRVVVYPNGNVDVPWWYEGDDSFQPFGVALADDGTAWVTSTHQQGSVIHLQFTGDRATGGFNVLFRRPIGNANKGVAIDAQQNIWVASGGDDTVYAFRPDGSLIGAYQGGGVNGPWGICLDGAGDVWVGNFGPLRPGGNFTGRLSRLAGANASTGVTMGDPLTPSSGYTLPSAGAQVLLSNGAPLYGENAPPCYIPMTRTTGLQIDIAGNVWTCNNWKPNFDVDTQGGNPGGDGIVIFLGVATPVSP